MHDVGNRETAPRAARGRNDAIGARLIASGLDAEGERRPTRDPRFDRAATRAITADESLGQKVEQAAEKLRAAAGA